MARKYICRWCREKDTDDKMTIVKVGKQNYRYHTEKCYEEYLKDKKFKEQESKELDELVETIKKVHDIEKIPRQFYPYLQDLRNGTELFGRIGQKKSKEGYRYKTIAETYLQCSDKIEWAKLNKNFKDTLSMLKYTYAIIANNIDQVKKQMDRAEENKMTNKEVDQLIDYDIKAASYKPQDDEDELNISEFL